MIHTLTTDNSLHIIHRDKAAMQDKLDKRRTFLLTLALFTVITSGVILWIVQ